VYLRKHNVVLSIVPVVLTLLSQRNLTYVTILTNFFSVNIKENIFMMGERERGGKGVGETICETFEAALYVVFNNLS
jgi:hypothetical protein